MRPIYQIDAFAAEPFRGNPAGVCLLEAAADEVWMQHVAAEMNLSETAFVYGEGDSYQIRYFTPTIEVPLCGHATLSTAHVLWQEGLVPADRPIVFRSPAGLLGARREGEWICLDFPAVPASPCGAEPELARLLRAEIRSLHRTKTRLLLAEMDSASVVRKLEPEITRLAPGGYPWVIVTAATGAEPPPAGDPFAVGRAPDFVSRFFAPGSGIPEDPVTGMAHSTLGPFWAQRLGRTELVAHQVSARGGVLHLRVGEERVDILGRAVTVFRGSLEA
jgi:PhzF family phenazine biosynthesis protein